MKKLLCNGLMLVAMYAAAQNSNPDNFQKMTDFLPPPPNAAAIIKHTDISINKNTGGPAINIPLCNVAGRKLSVGVSLGYSSTGIKVDEIASRAGMGWVLNAGGVVTRIIRGRPDEYATRIAPPYPYASSNCGTFNFLENATSTGSLTSGYDTEPDLFNFNMDGMSGSFVIDDGVAVVIPAEKFKIDYSLIGSDWNIKITNTDGVTYYFGGDGATEKTKRNNTCGRSYDEYRATAWYLRRVVHPNGEVINLSYAPLTYGYETGFSETRYWANPNPDTREIPAGAVVSCASCPAAPQPATCINTLSTQGVLLTGIYNSFSSVSFGYITRQDCGDRLLSTVSYTTGQTGGVYNLTYEEQSANMTFANIYSPGYASIPYLVELKESSPDLAFTKTHKFSYNDKANRPPRLSFSQDHWGYFNGKRNLESYIPEPNDFYLKQRFPGATANREPDPVYASKGLLNKIVYPTGGVDNIYYEANEVAGAVDNGTYHEYNSCVTGANNNSGSPVEVTKSTTFTIPVGQTAELDLSYLTINANDYDPIHMQARVVVTGTAGTILDESFQAASPAAQFVRFMAQPGTYTMQFSARGTAQSLTVKLKYNVVPGTNSNSNKIVGGLRVKRVMTGNPDETPMVKRYYYTDDINQLNASSLLPGVNPKYDNDFEKAVICTVSLGNSPDGSYVHLFCQLTAMYSSSVNNLFNFGSGAISYASVIESTGENFEGGAVQTKFLAGGDAKGLVWNGHEIMGAPLSNWSSPLNGKVKEEIVYKKASTGNNLFPIKKTQYTYSIDSRAHTKVYGYTVNKKWDIVEVVPSCYSNATILSDHLTGSFDVMRYDMDSYWAHLDTKTETLYDENGANPLTSTTNFFYDNTQHFQPTRTETLNSKNELVKTTNSYPADFAGNPVYDGMISQNIITPVITAKTENNGAEVSQSKLNYGSFGNPLVSVNYLPASVQKSAKGTTTFTTEGTFDLYDDYGNLQQFTDKTGVVTAIIWGYNYKYPVAQVIGSTYANAIAQLTVSMAALQAMDGTPLLTELNRIRTNLPQAKVTSYSYRPGAGVTAITDANNRTNSYNYDAFNRLLTVVNQDGYTVKKNEYVYTTPSAAAQPAIYLNDPLAPVYQCQSCLAGFTGSWVTYNIPQGKYYSLISQQDANAKAAADAGGQDYANRNGKCIFTGTCTGPANPPSGPPCTNCTGDNKKCINNICVTGTKVLVSAVHGKFGIWTCTYYYQFSDNTTYPAQAPYLTYTSTTGCDDTIAQ